MNLLTKETAVALWYEVIKSAEARCSVSLDENLEAYLISLLVRYANRPELAKQIFAQAFLEALQHYETYRNVSLQNVGDQCLLYAGLFPRHAYKKHVNISYFIDLGRVAYATISKTTDDVFKALSLEFVLLTDVLQSIRPVADLQPLEAYELWNETGSQRALKILQTYTQSLPLKKQ